METTPLKKKRRRIHQCSKCSFKQETKRTIIHYFHKHLSKKSIPFRCSLSGFKAMEENCWSKHLYGKQHLRALEKASYAKKQLGSERFCQTGPPFVPVISRNKDDRDADIYEMDRQESGRYGEADQV